MKEKYFNLKEKVENGNKPVVLVNGCTHGHEKVGAAVISELKDLEIKTGSLITNIANERAFEEGVAFCETDLNRCFPGKKDGTYEEQLAHHIHGVVTIPDVVIDIHSTKAWSPGAESALIVTKLDDATRNIIEIVNPPKVFVMKYTEGNALVSDAKIGIGFEYGKDKNLETQEYTTRDIKRILGHLNMIDERLVPEEGWKEYVTEYYEVCDVVKKAEGDVLESGIKNFVLVKKGDHIVTNSLGSKIIAEEDFYPVLFGENRYQDIFGFVGKRI